MYFIMFEHVRTYSYLCICFESTLEHIIMNFMIWARYKYGIAIIIIYKYESLPEKELHIIIYKYDSLPEKELPIIIYKYESLVREGITHNNLQVW